MARFLGDLQRRHPKRYDWLTVFLHKAALCFLQSLVFNMSTKRNARDIEMRQERVYYKFVFKYIEALHSDIHKEALDFMKSIKQKQPNVRDLTKTEEFMAVVMPDMKVPRHYKRRKLNNNKASLQDTKKQQPLQMELKIQMLQLPPSMSDMQPSPSAIQPSVSDIQPSVSNIQPSPSTIQPSVSDIQPSVSDIQPSPSDIQLSVFDTQSFLPLQQHIYEDLLSEIQKDPELFDIMNNFPDFDEPTPLEMELKQHY